MSEGYSYGLHTFKLFIAILVIMLIIEVPGGFIISALSDSFWMLLLWITSCHFTILTGLFEKVHS